MPLPTSGLISLDMVANELAIPNTNLELGDIRIRMLAGKIDGDISLSDLYGKSAAASVTGTKYEFQMYSNELEPYMQTAGFCKKFGVSLADSPYTFYRDNGTLTFISSSKLPFMQSSTDTTAGCLVSMGTRWNSTNLYVVLTGDQSSIKSMTLGGMFDYGLKQATSTAVTKKVSKSEGITFTYFNFTFGGYTTFGTGYNRTGWFQFD